MLYAVFNVDQRRVYKTHIAVVGNTKRKCVFALVADHNIIIPFFQADFACLDRFRIIFIQQFGCPTGLCKTAVFV